jgi:hypothetical protein
MELSCLLPAESAPLRTTNEFYRLLLLMELS